MHAGIFREHRTFHRASGQITLERKEVSRATKSKVHVREVFVKVEVVTEYELEEEDVQQA